VSGPRRILLDGLSLVESLTLANELAVARLACFPTDTVYGIGGSLRAEVGEAIVAAKGREPDKPLQVIFPTRELLFQAVEFTPAMADVMYRLLPGPVTLVIPYPAGFRYPPPATADVSTTALFGLRRTSRRVETLGVRVPRWPEAARLLTTLTYPLIASSANPSGAASPGTLDEVAPALLAECDVILDGGPAGGVASTVVDLTSYDERHAWRILREGAMSGAQIEEALKRRRDDLPAV
jgi:L-threonylcarbamoyladenylate synthase